ncbi:MAG: hypothetical protein JXR07_09380 [Reichenbachiella sp.]
MMKSVFIPIMLFLLACKEEGETSCEDAYFQIPESVLEDLESDQSFAESAVGYIESGHIKYLVIDQCCDLYVSYYNVNWEYLCSTGGFDGQGDGLCEESDLTKQTCNTILWRRNPEE